MGQEDAYRELENVDSNILFNESQKYPIVLLLIVDWSGASHIMDTYIEDLSEKYQDNFQFYHQDAEKFELLSQQLNAKVFPTTYIIKEGTIVESFQGILSRKKIEMKLIALM